MGGGSHGQWLSQGVALWLLRAANLVFRGSYKAIGNSLDITWQGFSLGMKMLSSHGCQICGQAVFVDNLQPVQDFIISLLEAFNLSFKLNLDSDENILISSLL